MLYQILHENDSSFRIRLGVQQITPQEEEILSQILASHPQISGISIYPATAGVRIFFKGSKKAVLDSLRKIPYSNVRYLAEQLPKPEDIHVHLLPTSQQFIQEFRGNPAGALKHGLPCLPAPASFQSLKADPFIYSY